MKFIGFVQFRPWIFTNHIKKFLFYFLIDFVQFDYRIFTSVTDFCNEIKENYADQR